MVILGEYGSHFSEDGEQGQFNKYGSSFFSHYFPYDVLSNKEIRRYFLNVYVHRIVFKKYIHTSTSKDI